MQIIIDDKWLKACGYMQASGIPLTAEVIENASWSAMGTCYKVTLPDGRPWQVFHCRGVTIL